MHYKLIVAVNDERKTGRRTYEGECKVHGDCILGILNYIHKCDILTRMEKKSLGDMVLMDNLWDDNKHASYVASSEKGFIKKRSRYALAEIFIGE